MSGMHSASISNCVIRYIDGNGIYVYGENGAKPTITLAGSTIQDNTGHGVEYYMDDSGTVLSGTVGVGLNCTVLRRRVGVELNCTVLSRRGGVALN